MAGVVSVHVSIDQQESVQQFKPQVEHRFAVLENALRIEQQKTHQLKQELTIMKEGITETLMRMNEDAEQKINTFKACTDNFAARVYEILIWLEQQMGVYDSKMAEMYETGQQLQECVANIKDENLDLKKKIEKQDIGMERLKEETEQKMNALKVGMDAHFAKITTVLAKQMKSYVNVRLAKSDLQFQIRETANFDGKLVWKIKDFSRSKEGDLSIYSQPFYTSKYGYKFCFIIYLNGHEIGKNTHISLYLVLMKGEYDAILQFNTAFKVILSLLDQSSESHNMTLESTLDPSFSSFMKPMYDMNIVMECPLFVSHDQLNGNYVVDDAIFVKAVIDTIAIYS